MKAIYPGRFDPITNGHIDVYERASTLFDEVIIAVAEHPEKPCLFSAKERVDLIKKALPRARIVTFSGLTVECAKEQGAKAMVRGLRAVSDFDYEFQFALMNRKLTEDVETVFVMTRGEYAYLRSSAVKEVVRYGGELKGLVPPAVEKALRDAYGLR